LVYKQVFIARKITQTHREPRNSVHALTSHFLNLYYRRCGPTAVHVERKQYFVTNSTCVISVVLLPAVTFTHKVCTFSSRFVQELKIVCVCSKNQSQELGFDPRQGQRIFPLISMSRPALGPTQPRVQWVPGGPFPGTKRGRYVTLTAHPHLVLRSRMSRNYTSPPKRHHGV
jgi:hypothetical protein